MTYNIKGENKDDSFCISRKLENLVLPLVVGVTVTSNPLYTLELLKPEEF